MKINNKKESQNIAINNSADIDYKHFMKIYRECTKKTYSFLTIDTILTTTDLLRFKKNWFSLIKMTVADEIKILDRKIKQNKVQYNLDRKIAKISAFSSNDLENISIWLMKIWILNTVEQAKFEYSPLGEIFNNALKG